MRVLLRFPPFTYYVPTLSSNGHGSSNGSGSDSAGKDNSPTNEANEDLRAPQQRAALHAMRTNTGRSAPGFTETANKDNISGRKRRAPASAPSDGPTRGTDPQNRGQRPNRSRQGLAERPSEEVGAVDVAISAGQRESTIHAPYGSESSWTAMYLEDGLHGLPSHIPCNSDDGRWAQELLNSPLAQVISCGTRLVSSFHHRES